MERERIRNNLQGYVSFLADTIGSRGYLQTEQLNRAADFISSELSRFGYDVKNQSYDVQGQEYKNIYTQKTGARSPDKVIVIGAHYDTVTGTPGADDNASGVAGVLELARLFSEPECNMTLNFVCFPLEEPPFFRSRHMGSYVYAGKLHKEGIYVDGMVCLESIGYYSNIGQSQYYPLPLFRYIYPDRGNFITFIGNRKSRKFMEKAKKGFMSGTDFPIESLATVSAVPGVDFSDHRSFWKFGFRAFMVTDTAFYRNPFYHGEGDLPDTLDFDSMTEVVAGLYSAIEELAKDRPSHLR